MARAFQPERVERFRDELPARLTPDAPRDPRKPPEYSLGAPGMGLVLTWFGIPVIAAAVIFLLALLLLRNPRSSRDVPLAARRVRLDRAKPRPAQGRSHWTVSTDDESGDS